MGSPKLAGLQNLNTIALTNTICNSLTFYFSDFLSVLLYLAKINGKILNPADLPELPSSRLSQISTLTNPSGITYQMATVAFDTLRRYKESMSVYLSSWVNRLDAPNMLLAIQDTIRESSAEFANVRIEKATQEVLLKNRFAKLF